MLTPLMMLFCTVLPANNCGHHPVASSIKRILSQDELLHLNQIQIIASHNSYRQMTTKRIYRLLRLIGGLLPDDLNPRGLDYEHLPIDQQLSECGVRGLEIDIYNDPEGGAFVKRRMNFFTLLRQQSGIAELDKPGFKVLHIKDVDYNTNYYTFKQALQAVKAWSDAHPGHLPLFINIESKTDTPGDRSALRLLKFQPAPAYVVPSADSLDAEIRSVFGNELCSIITPDKLRGSLPALNDVVTQNKWPQLRNCRGKIIFIMEGALAGLYMEGHPSLTGRAMFVYAEPGTSEAAFVICNDPITDHERIKKLVESGYIVRTRCDADTREARSGDYIRMGAAFSSGAQINSTDYYKPDRRAGRKGWSYYSVKFPNGMLARKNPVNAASIETENELKD